MFTETLQVQSTTVVNASVECVHESRQSIDCDIAVQSTTVVNAELCVSRGRASTVTSQVSIDCVIASARCSTTFVNAER